MGAEHVFDGDGHAGERPQPIAGGDARIDGFGLSVGALGREREIGVELTVASGDAEVELVSELARGDFARGCRRAWWMTEWVGHFVLLKHEGGSFF